MMTAQTDPAPTKTSPQQPQAVQGLRQLAIDLGIPLGTYFLLRDGFGLSLWLSLALSSVGPAVRSIASLRREVNLLALLMLTVNVAGIGVSFITGDPRALIAKDSLVSSIVGIAILGSLATRKPIMSAGLRPYLTRGAPARLAAWDRLALGSAKFRNLERAFSAIWGVALLGECVARLIGAYTLPVATMAWLGTVMTVAAIMLAVVGGGIAAAPMHHLIEEKVDAERRAARLAHPGAECAMRAAGD